MALGDAAETVENNNLDVHSVDVVGNTLLGNGNSWFFLIFIHFYKVFAATIQIL